MASKTNGMTFNEFLAKIGEAVQHVQRMSNTAVEKRWLDMTTASADGAARVPKTLVLELDGKRISVPELALTHPGIVPLKQIKISFSAQVDVGPGEVTDADTGTVISIRPRKGLSKRSSHFDVEMTFSAEEPPEALEILRDQLTQGVKNQIGG